MMSNNTKLKVLIAGGGIAGHSLAYWLTRTGLDASITVIERAKEPRITGQAIDIRGPAVSVIKLMKLDDKIRSKHTTEEGLAFVDTNGKINAQFDATGDEQHQAVGTSEYEILRADLAEILFDGIKDKESINYVYGESIKTLHQTEQAVEITLESGTKESYDLVVAADGSTSRTRAMILDEETASGCYKFMGQYIGFFSIAHQEGDSKLWQWYNTSKGRMASLRPHADPKTMGAYLCITMPTRETRDAKVEEALDQGVEQQKSLLQDYFKDAGWQSARLLEGLHASKDFYMSRIAQVKLPRWTNGRALVIGDAAHASMGTGTSLAIEGAYVLAGELSKITSPADVPDALLRYEEIFRPLVDQCTYIPGFVPQIANPQTDWGVWLLNTAVWAVSRSRLYKLFQGIGEPDASKWTLPEYYWKDF